MDDPSPNAFDVPTFCTRNGMSVSTFYKAVRDGHITLTKLYGKTLVLAANEAEFRTRLAAGELAAPKRPEWRKGRPRKPADQAAA